MFMIIDQTELQSQSTGGTLLVTTLFQYFYEAVRLWIIKLKLHY